LKVVGRHNRLHLHPAKVSLFHNKIKINNSHNIDIIVKFYHQFKGDKYKMDRSIQSFNTSFNIKGYTATQSTTLARKSSLSAGPVHDKGLSRDFTGDNTPERLAYVTGELINKTFKWLTTPPSRVISPCTRTIPIRINKAVMDTFGYQYEFNKVPYDVQQNVEKLLSLRKILRKPLYLSEKINDPSSIAFQDFFDSFEQQGKCSILKEKNVTVKNIVKQLLKHPEIPLVVRTGSDNTEVIQKLALQVEQLIKKLLAPQNKIKNPTIKFGN